MAEIEITLPTIQYGNVKITGTPEEWGLDTIADAPDVGVWAATYLNLFQQGFRHGAKMDVDAHLGAPEQSDGTDVHAEAQRLLEEQLGASEVGEENPHPEESDPDEAPWNSTVDSKPKPWETENKPKVAVSDEW